MTAKVWQKQNKKNKHNYSLDCQWCFGWSTPFLFWSIHTLFYCIKMVWIDQNKKGCRSTKTSLTVHAVCSFFWLLPLLTHVQSIFLSLNSLYLFSLMYSPSQYAVLPMKRMMTLIQGPPLLVSANTIPMFLTVGAGAKPLLGSANTVQCQVRLGFNRNVRYWYISIGVS